MTSAPSAWIELATVRGALPRLVGVPVVVRHVRLARRLGWTGAHVAARDADEAAAVRALVAPVATADFVVTVGVGGRPPLDAVVLHGDAIYRRLALAAWRGGGRPVAAIILRGERDRDVAKQLLLAEVRKSLALDGVVSYYVIRPLVRPLVRWLVDTRVTPNQITLAALVCGLAAALLCARGGAGAAALAGIAYWLGGAIDHIDGDVARLRLTSSRVGEWLDAMTDEVSTFAMLAGVAIGLHHDRGVTLWLTAGLGLAALDAITVGRLYFELARRRLPIDTAQFPWFFAGAAGPRRGWSAAVISAGGMLLRRDVNVTVVAALLLCNQRPAVLVLVGSGVTIGFALMATHVMVTAVSRARR